MEIVVIILYSLSLLYIFLFSISQLHLTLIYRRQRKNTTDLTPDDNSKTKAVTVQLPVYNEKYVVARLIEAVGKLDYPADKLEVQVLDDSTDETTQIITEKIKSLQSRGLDIKLIRRADRQGFKAGALQHALPLSSGELIVIFDADFIPEPDFLKKTLPSFSDPSIGAVQTRWGHINQEYSLLTELQAFTLDAHFSIEQSARNAAGSFINFNGTCGVWRKSCITDAGGWSAETLTEDLDLSYRAQLKDWKFKYLEEVATPGELPIVMQAVKSQQYRWNKGGAEVAKKVFFSVAKSDMPLINKLHAFFHLLNSSVFVASFLAGTLSIPMLFIKEQHPALGWVLRTIFLVGLGCITLFFWTATKKFHKDSASKFIKLFPGFLSIFMGLSLHNGLAVIEGLLGIKTPFMRTPKFNITGRTGTWKGNAYLKPTISPLTIVEGLLCLYFIFGIGVGVYLQDVTLLIFHVMLAFGYGMVFYQTVRPVAA